MIREIYVELTRRWKSWEYCGTKAAGLFELEAMNVPVPNFYVIPVVHFQQFCNTIYAYPLSEFYHRETYDCTTYQKCFNEQKVQVISKEMLDTNRKFIVRSSAVPQEETQVEDFASKVSGAFDSFIASDFSKVGEMTLAVWQSIYSESAYEKLHVFQQEFGLKGMAVVVQQYIKPVISGIVHTHQNKISVNWIVEPQEEILQDKAKGEDIEVYLSSCGEIVLRGKEDCVKHVAESMWKTVFQKIYSWSMRIRDKKCSEQEIEWIYDGESVWVVQSQNLVY